MIAIVGSSNMDVVLSVEHFTQPAETQICERMNFFPGGKGANQAITVAKLSRKGAYFSSCLGNDEFGEVLAKDFSDNGLSGFFYVDRPTGRAFIEVTKDGQNRIIVYSGANAELSKERLNWKTLLESDFLLLQNEIPFETTLDCAKKFPGVVIFDPAPAHHIDVEILKYVDYITPNEDEIKSLSIAFFDDFVSIEDSASRFLDLGVGNVVVKLGDKGAMLINREGMISIPSFNVRAVDTTAAGDVFNGAFAVALSENMDLRKSLIFAAAAAAISVTRVGAQTSIPSRAEVDDFLKVHN